MNISKGSKAPDFSYVTVKGTGQLAQKIQEAEKTILVFSRYLGCPLCQLNLLSYCEEYARIQQKNAQILLVLQSSLETLQNQTLVKEPPFDIISDPNMELYQLFHVPAAKNMLSMLALNGKLLKKAFALSRRKLKHGAYEGNEQQLPALFILGKDRTVLHAHYASSISDMPDMDELLQLL